MTRRLPPLAAALLPALLTALLTAGCLHPTDDHPPLGEICNGIDDDLDHRIDEDFDVGDPCAVGVGRCHRAGTIRCDPDGQPTCDARPGPPGREVCNTVDDDCDGLVDEGVETCNGVDDDCDGVVDEEPDGTICPGFEDNPGSGVRACRDTRCVIAQCSPGRVDLDDGLSGEPAGYRNGCETACTPSATRLDVCVGGQPKGCTDNCDGQDDDCDGVVDEQEQEPPTSISPGVCAGAPWVCDGGWSEPNYAEAVAAYELDEITCDGLDNDCDGRIDEGIVTCDSNCDGIDDDADGRVDEVRACAETTCATDTRLPPCNGCPEGTAIPGAGDPDGEWVCVPAGEFTMGRDLQIEGCEHDFPSARPPRRVAIGRPFLVMTGEVTRGSFLDVFGEDPSSHRDDAPDHEKRPVESVSWVEATQYANARSRQLGFEDCYVHTDCNDGIIGARCPDGSDACEAAHQCASIDVRPDCDGVRLPTEAEWEYAARAETHTIFWHSDGEERDQHDWTQGNSDGRTHPTRCPPQWLRGDPCVAPDAVEGEQPGRANPWGLFDLHGNVMEWTQDWYGSSFYREAAEAIGRDPDPDPPGPGVARCDPDLDCVRACRDAGLCGDRCSGEADRVVRGYSYTTSAGGGAFKRTGIDQDARWGSVGFRLVRRPSR